MKRNYGCLKLWLIINSLSVFGQKSVEVRNNTAPTQSAEEESSIAATEPASKIITTEEEIEGFFIVKSILRNVIEASRITYRDTQSYFGILIDDNNRKAICRLYLNSPTNKQLAIINEAKQEIKYKIESLDDLYNYSEQLIEEVKRFI